MNQIQFDPTEDRSAEVKAAEAAALEQGEKIRQMQEEDRSRRFQENEAVNEQPELIAGKFKSQEDLLKAYEELQKKLGNPEAAGEEPSEEVESAEERVEEEPAEEQSEEEPQVAETVQYMHQLSKEVGDAGELSEEAIDKLASLDTKDLIKAYMTYNSQAQQATIAGAELQAIKDSVGGDQAYGEMVQWAAQNLSESEIADFNAVTNTNNPAAIRFAVQALNSRWKDGNGYEADLVTGRKAAATNDRFRSHAELSRAIADPRYATDPAYRQDVELKLARSRDLL